MHLSSNSNIWYGTIAYFVLHLAWNEASDFEKKRKERKREGVALAWQGTELWTK